jgi:Kef-type K+ transport system membrane component KefB
MRRHLLAYSLLMLTLTLGTATMLVAALQLVSQIGVILFMFFVGADIDLAALRPRLSAALLISHAGIMVPFALGIALALPSRSRSCSRRSCSCSCAR